MEEVLLKYFKGQCSSEELLQVEAFQKNHPREYRILEQLWKNRSAIDVSDYDVQAAWKQVESQITSQRKPLGKSRTLFTILSRVAATVAFLVLVGWAAYQLFSTEEMITITGLATGTPIILDDGSTIWLNEGAEFQYPEHFSGDTREVFLKGEGFFEVARDKSSPFIVNTDRSQIKVLGTSFSVLETDSSTRVSVSLGKVGVSAKDKEEAVELIKGEEALVSLNSVVKRKAPPNYESWRTGEFTFDNTPLPEVVKQLKTYYRTGLPETIPESDCQLTAKIGNMEISEVIELIEAVCDIKF